MPGEKMIVSGKGWLPNESVNLVLTEQELLDPSWTDITKTVVCDVSGTFSIDLFELVQANLGAFFHITATGQTSNHVCTITCNDAGGDYGIDFSAYNPQSYESYNVSNVPPAPVGSGISPLGPTRHNNTRESLMPQYLALGQIVAYEFIVRVDKGGACPNDKIRIGGEFLTVTTNGRLFGFEPVPVNLFAAFVDTDPDDADYKDTGTQATVLDFGADMDKNAVSAWVELEGMDPGDVILVEIWVVLQDEITMDVNGNVKTRLTDAATIGGCENGKINTGNQEIPLLQVDDFFTTDVDISVIKTDNQDPVNPGDEITYTMVVNNAGPSVANDVVLSDIMDPNTTYIEGSWSASSSVSANDGMWQSISVSGQTITSATPNIYMKIGETVTITYKVKVNLTAPATSTGGAGSPTSCVTRADLCNFVEVTTISDDTNLANNQYYQPTGVIGLNITLVPSPITCWNYDGYTSDGAIDLTITGGPSVTSYSWTGPGGFTGSIEQNLTGLNIPGEYTVTITFSNGLIIIRSTVVNAPLYQCTVDAGDDESICYGEQATLSAVASGGVGSYTYEWFDDVALTNLIGSAATLTVSPATTTTYYVKATDENGCYGIDEVRVNVLSVPVCSIDGDAAICPSETATYSGPEGEGLTYNWSISGNASIDGAIDSKLVAINSSGDCDGRFTLVLTVTNEDDCSSICEKTVLLKDETPPTFASCPTTSIDLGCNPKTLPNSDMAIAAVGTITDNCDADVAVTATGGEITGDCTKTQVWTVLADADCGPDATCTVTYRWKEDLVLPVITTTTEDAYLGCSPSSTDIGIALGSATALDNCDGNISYRVISQNGPVFTENGCLYFMIRTFDVTDLCGNAAVQKTVKVTWTRDDTAPTFASCPSEPIDLGCNPETLPDSDMAIAAVGTITDNCDADVAVTATGGEITGECTKTQVWTVVADADCGPDATCTVTYTWKEDLLLPVITTTTEDAYLGCSPSSTDIGIALGSATALDNCDGNISYRVISQNGPVFTENGCLYFMIRTFDVTDLCGNAAVQKTVKVTWTRDDTAPTFASCPSEPIDLGCNPKTLPDSDMAIAAVGTITDNCDADVAVTATGGEITGDCTKTQVWTVFADSDCGPDAECLVSYTWTVDTEAPTFANCPAEPIALGCNPKTLPNSDMAIAVVGTVLDNCDASVTVTASGGAITGTCTKSQTWTVSADADCGPDAECTVTYTWIEDNTPPVWDQELPSAEIILECGETLPDLYLTATDNCGGVTYTAISNITLGVCPIIEYGGRRITATDVCGNSISFAQGFKIEDTTPPVWNQTMPGDLLVECGNVPSFPSGITATDKCDDNVEVYISEDDWVFDICGYEIIRTFTARDDCMNVTTHVQTITVKPAPAPELTIYSIDKFPVTMSCTDANNWEELLGSYMYASYSNGQTGNCLISGEVGPTVSEVWTLCEGGTLTFVWKVTEVCELSLEYTHVITVLPAPAAILTIPTLPTSISCSEAAAFTSVADATFTNGESGTCENSGRIPGVLVPDWNMCYGGYITVRWEGTDYCGNILEKWWTMKVRHALPTVLTVPALPDKLTCAEADLFETPANATYTNGEAGGCLISGSIPAEVTHNWNICDGGTIKVVYEGTVQCGYQFFEKIIQVAPAPAPTLSVPDLPDNLTCAQADAFILPDDATYSNVDKGTCLISGSIAASVIHDWTLCNGGTITVTYSGTDQCGYLMEYSKIINVERALPASFLYLPDDISMSCDEYETFVPSYLAYSNAGPLKLAVISCVISGEVLGELSGEFDACGGTIYQTWTFTDLCGRTITHVQNIHLYDETPPVIALVGDITMEGCNPNWPEIAAAWTDNCSAGGVVKGVAGDVVTDACQQYRYYTFNVLDECLNPATEVKMKVTRKYDIAPPDFVVPADFLVDMSGNCAYDIDPMVTGIPTKIIDNCVGDIKVDYTDSQPIEGICDANFTITRTWIVTDDCGNSVRKPQIITVVDNLPPVLDNCPKDITICDNETMAEIILPSASDNCDTEVPVDWLRSDGAIGLNDKFEPGETTISFTAADDCGNTASCSMKVTVYRAPDITVEDLTDCSTDEGGITAVFTLEDAITSIYFPSGTAVFVSSLHGQILSTQEALDNYIGTDGEQITITLTTLEKCTASATFVLHVVKRPVLTVQDLTECSTLEGGNTATFNFLTNVSAVGGNLAFSSSINGSLLLANMNAYVGTDGEIITVSSTSPPPALCQTIKSFTITVHPSPILQAATASFCEDEYTNFDITAFNEDVLADGQNVGDFDFVWSSLASPNMPTMSNPSAVTEYFVTVTNTVTKCSSDAKLTITVNLCSWLNLTKATNKLVVPELNWTFILYEGTFGNLTEIASETTQGVIDGVLFRDAGPLSRHTMYTVCEQGVPAGYGTTWMIDSELDGVFLIIPYTTSPGTGGVYNPNSVDDPPQDLGNRCYTFDGSMLPINNFGSAPPLALQLTVDNTFPGGDARTPGYWKNWNTCTGGGQQYTASENAYELDGLEGISAYDRVYSGWALLDDIIDLFGITWGEFELATCDDAQKILDNRDLTGVNRSSDPAYTLAKHLLAYQLNQGAGSYICYDMTDIETEAVALLVKINFAGEGDYLRKTTPATKALASRALALAAILDAYNNNEGCEALAEMIDPDSDPIDEVPLSCTTTVTNITRKTPVGKVVVNAIGGKTPYLYSMVDGATNQTSNVFEITAAGTYTFTVTDNSIPTLTCTCTAKVTTNVKSASISAIVMPGDELASELKVYPNPFISAVYFEFVSGRDANARLEIFNLLGQKVNTLLDQRVETGVLNRIEYRPIATPGVLFYRLSLDDEIFNGKLIYNKE